MKKNIARFVCLLLAVAVCVPLVACAGSSSSASNDTSALKEKISSTLADLKACEGDPFQLAVDAVKSAGIDDQLEGAGMTYEELCRAYIACVDFEVGEVTISGSSAQAKLTISRPSITAIGKSYLKSTLFSSADKQAILDAISGTDVEKTETTLYISQKDGEWDVNDALVSALRHSLM